MLSGQMTIEGRCADCVLDLLQLSGRGPGRFGYCRLRRIVLEHPWAMICSHYQCWEDRPTPGKPRILLERPTQPILEYSSQKPIQVSFSPDELKARHENEVDDDIKRNVGAAATAQEFVDAPTERQYDLLNGFLSGFNPYNFTIAVNALHHLPIEDFSKDKQTALLEMLLSEERKADLSGDPGIIADKLAMAAGWALARIGRDLPAYLDSLNIKKMKPDYEKRLQRAALEFVRNPNLKPRLGLFSFLFGR